MFCGENTGFLLKIFLESQQLNEGEKISCGHFKCIYKRNACIKMPDINSFLYQNFNNFLKRK